MNKASYVASLPTNDIKSMRHVHAINNHSLAL